MIKFIEKFVLSCMNKKFVMEWLKRNPLNEDEVLSLYVKTIDDVNTATIDPRSYEKLVSELSKVEGYSEYLRLTIAKDMQTYFNAQTPLEQCLVKGAANRTMYFRRQLINSKDS